MNAGADYGIHVKMVICFRLGSQFRLDRCRSMASQAKSGSLRGPTIDVRANVLGISSAAAVVADPWRVDFQDW